MWDMWNDSDDDIRLGDDNDVEDLLVCERRLKRAVSLRQVALLTTESDVVSIIAGEAGVQVFAVPSADDAQRLQPSLEDAIFISQRRGRYPVDYVIAQSARSFRGPKKKYAKVSKSREKFLQKQTTEPGTMMLVDWRDKPLLDAVDEDPAFGGLLVLDGPGETDPLRDAVSYLEERGKRSFVLSRWFNNTHLQSSNLVDVYYLLDLDAPDCDSLLGLDSNDLDDAANDVPPDPDDDDDDDFAEEDITDFFVDDDVLAHHDDDDDDPGLDDVLVVDDDDEDDDGAVKKKKKKQDD